MTTYEPANGYLPVPGPTSLCAYLAILITCGTVILLTWSWGAIGKLVSLLKVEIGRASCRERVFLSV